MTSNPVEEIARHAEAQAKLLAAMQAAEAIELAQRNAAKQQAEVEDIERQLREEAELRDRLDRAQEALDSYRAAEAERAVLEAQQREQRQAEQSRMRELAEQQKLAFESQRIAQQEYAQELARERQADEARLAALDAQAKQEMMVAVAAEEQIRLEQAAEREAEKQRERQLEDANRAVVGAREEARQRLGMISDEAINRARHQGNLDTTVEELRAVAERESGTLDPKLRERDQLAADSARLDSVPSAALSTVQNDGVAADRFVKEQKQQIEESAAPAASDHEQNVSTPGAPSAQGIGTLLVDDSQPASLSQGTQVAIETKDRAEDAERAADIVNDGLKEIGEHNAMGAAAHFNQSDIGHSKAAGEHTPQPNVFQPDIPGASNAQAAPALQSEVGISDGSALEHAMAQPAGVENVVYGTLLAGTMAVVQGVQMYQQTAEWLKDKFASRGEDTVTPVAGSTQDAASTNSAAPTQTRAPEAVLPAGAEWVPPTEPGAVASAAARHEAFYAQAPDVGGPNDGLDRSWQQQRAEAGIAEWQSFRNEQSALDQGIAQALKNNDQDTAAMLELRKQVEGSEFAHQTGLEVQNLVSYAHGRDSVQAVDAQMRTEDLAQRAEVARDQWAARAVRNDLYQPLDAAMAEKVDAWRERERCENDSLATRTEGMTQGEREKAEAEHRERQDRALSQAFNLATATPTSSYSM